MSTQKYVSWAEAVERVGRAIFGDYWISELSGHDQWLLDEGCFGAAGVAEWEAADAKAKEGGFQHEEVLAWLQQNCFTQKQLTTYKLGYFNGSPLVGHPRVEETKFPRATFEKRIAAAFPTKFMRSEAAIDCGTEAPGTAEQTLAEQWGGTIATTAAAGGAGGATSEQTPAEQHDSVVAPASKKAWKEKSGKRLTKSERAVLAALNANWANGTLNR